MAERRDRIVGKDRKELNRRQVVVNGKVAQEEMQGQKQPKEVESYANDISIDKYVLDEEWLKQPTIFMKWVDNYAQAVLERDRIKDRLDVVRAEIDGEIRTNPPEGGKLTEAAISNIIVQSQRYRTIMDGLIKANYDVNVLSGVKESLNHKKSALENLTKLFLAGYYTSPHVPSGMQEQVDRKTSDQLKERLEKSFKNKRDLDED